MIFSWCVIFSGTDMLGACLAEARVQVPEMRLVTGHPADDAVPVTVKLTQSKSRSSER